MAHRSDSLVQREAESLMRNKVAEVIGQDLQSATVRLDTGAPVQVDGAAADESVLVEIFARQGKLKAGQQKEVALDAFKLITLARGRPDAELILAFADEDAAAYARGKGWLAEALASWSVKIVVVELDERERAKIRAAQVLQEIENPSDDA